MTRILVTGGAGYVGAVSVEAFLAAGHEVVVLDDLSTGHRAAVPDGARLVVGDYGDGRRLPRFSPTRRSRRSSIAPHARSSASRWWSPPATSGTTSPAASRCSRPRGEAGVDRFVLSSTAAVYGVPDATPITEDAPLRPINPYGETKRSFEGALDWYARAYGLRSVSLRYFNVAGATDAIGEDHDPETHLIPAILQAVERGPAADAVRRRLPDPRRDVRPRLHPRVRPRRRAPPRARGDRRGRRAHRRRSARLQPRQRRRASATWRSSRPPRPWSGRPIAYEVGPRRPGDPPVLVASAERATAVLGWAAAATGPGGDGRLGVGLAPATPGRLRRLTDR